MGGKPLREEEQDKAGDRRHRLEQNLLNHSPAHQSMKIHIYLASHFLYVGGLQKQIGLASCDSSRWHRPLCLAVPLMAESMPATSSRFPINTVTAREGTGEV